MKSFPSAFTKDDLVQPGKLVSTNLQQTLKNIAGSIMNNSLGGSEVSKDSLGERLKETWVKYDYDDSIDNINFTINTDKKELDGWRLYDKVSNNGAFHENARKIPALTLASINKYRKIFAVTAAQISPVMKGRDGTEAQEYYSEAVSPSLFNGLFGVRSQGVTINTPLMFTSSINYGDDFENKNESNDSNVQEAIDINIQELNNKIADFTKQIAAIDSNIDSYNSSSYTPQEIDPNAENADELRKQNEQQKQNFEKNKSNQIAELNDLKNSLQMQIEELTNKIKSLQNGDTTALDIDPSTLANRPHANVIDLDQKSFVQLNNDDYDFTDCSIKTLVELSNGKYKGNPVNSRQTLGRATYRYADFMFCEDLGKISNNHLITLRKFIMPIGDNIYRYPGEGSEKELGCIGKMITWFGTDKNKLSDICKYDYSASWKQLKAEIEQVNSEEDDPHKLPSIINMLNPSYNNYVKKGICGSGNSIYGWVAGKSNIFGKGTTLDNTGSYENHKIFTMYDQNKVYEPKNTIQDTHIYEGKLTFNQQIKLKFNYTLRSYDGINPKSAFLDLIGNILNVTYKEGVFWGGSKRWIGAPRNVKGWKKMNKMFDKLDKGLHGGLDDLFGCSSLEQLASLCGNWLKGAANFLKGAVNEASNMISNGTAKSVAKKAAHSALDVFQGMLKNKLGRPAMYALQSLLNDDNVGLWHLTVGNPRNPILSMGNLILKDATITHYGPLGIDDFPTGLEVDVTLIHARSRDSRGIGEMYTCGEGDLILPLTSKTFEQYYGPLTSETANEYEVFGLNGYGDISSEDVKNIWNLKI